MQLTLKGKTALVTGGANGLGRMIAEYLLGAGAAVIITSRRPVNEALASLRELGECHGIEVDLRRPEAVNGLTERLRGITAKLPILINNAGTTWGAPLEQFPDKAWGTVMDLNVRVPFAIVQRMLPLLAAAGSPGDPARIVNIGSVAGASYTGLNAYSYSASKAALHHLGRELAVELANRNITVNTVIPGYFPTKMTAHVRADEEQTAQLIGRIPLRRMGEPRDIGGVCVFLSSSLAAYITGAQIVVDGGITAAG